MGPAGNSPPAPPRVSILTATYNWSRALKCAIESALLQTFSDFELLVTGDGCTDDSEAVANSFGDPRVRWTNLPANSGNQVAPNNDALRRAQGEYIAYLGHDDIWYPTHLESLVRTIEATGADLVGSVAILYGPPESEVRAVTGIFPGGRFTPGDFMPPSSILHRRSLAERIGGWTKAEDSVLPPDIEFEQRALAAGARIETSGELTVFKFNAAWRRNSYRLKSALEQEAMLARIRAGTDIRQRELVDALRSVIEDRFIRIAVPGSPGNTAPNRAKGEYVRENIRFKGSGSGDPPGYLRGAQRFYLEGQARGFEWHALECDERHGSFRWSGPSRVSTLELPVWSLEPISVRVHVLQHLCEDLAADLRLTIDGVPAAATFEQTEWGTTMVSAVRRPDAADRPERMRQPLSVTLQLARTVRPCDRGPSDDHRWLGAAVNWVEVAPAEPDR